MYETHWVIAQYLPKRQDKVIAFTLLFSVVIDSFDRDRAPLQFAD